MIRSPIAATGCSCASESQTITNSSPLRRPSVSWPRTTLRRAGARRRCRMRSPDAWPSVSLIALKPSRSMKNTAVWVSGLRRWRDEGACELVADQHAVGQARERVVRRLVAQPRRRLLALHDAAQLGADLGHQLDQLHIAARAGARSGTRARRRPRCRRGSGSRRRCEARRRSPPWRGAARAPRRSRAARPRCGRRARGRAGPARLEPQALGRPPERAEALLPPAHRPVGTSMPSSARSQACPSGQSLCSQIAVERGASASSTLAASFAARATVRAAAAAAAARTARASRARRSPPLRGVRRARARARRSARSSRSRRSRRRSRSRSGSARRRGACTPAARSRSAGRSGRRRRAAVPPRTRTGGARSGSPSRAGRASEASNVERRRDRARVELAHLRVDDLVERQHECARVVCAREEAPDSARRAAAARCARTSARRRRRAASSASRPPRRARTGRRRDSCRARCRRRRAPAASSSASQVSSPCSRTTISSSRLKTIPFIATAPLSAAQHRPLTVLAVGAYRRFTTEESRLAS